MLTCSAHSSIRFLWVVVLVHRQISDWCQMHVKYTTYLLLLLWLLTSTSNWVMPFSFALVAGWCFNCPGSEWALYLRVTGILAASASLAVGLAFYAYDKKLYFNTGCLRMTNSCHCVFFLERGDQLPTVKLPFLLILIRGSMLTLTMCCFFLHLFQLLQ